MLNDRLREITEPSLSLAAVESMVLFKGRPSLTQYMPLEAVKRGYTMCCLPDCETSYILNFQIKAGRNDNDEYRTLY
jgi:hypothetical protein